MSESRRTWWGNPVMTDCRWSLLPRDWLIEGRNRAKRGLEPDGRDTRTTLDRLWVRLENLGKLVVRMAIHRSILLTRAQLFLLLLACGKQGTSKPPSPLYQTLLSFSRWLFLPYTTQYSLLHRPKYCLPLRIHPPTIAVLFSKKLVRSGSWWNWKIVSNLKKTSISFTSQPLLRDRHCI